jgi:hypothetical protein
LRRHDRNYEPICFQDRTAKSTGGVLNRERLSVEHSQFPQSREIPASRSTPRLLRNQNEPLPINILGFISEFIAF